jgi:hypothetical protein
MSERARKNGVIVLPPMGTVSQVALVLGAIVGALLLAIGVRVMIVGGFPTLFGVALAVLGALGLALGAAARLGKRPAWAVLIAMWLVLAICAFFAAPKIVDLPKLESATVEMELKLGRKKAEEVIEERNLIIRLQNLGACTLFALPFALLCAGLLAGGRDFEPRKS